MAEIGLLPERRKSLEFGTKKFRFGSGLLILIFVLVAFGGLNFYSYLLKKEMNDLDKKIEEVNKNRDKTQEERIFKVKERLDQSLSLLQSRPIWSKGFKKVQDLTIPAIKLKNFNASLTQETFEFGGISPDLITIARQMANYFSEKSVKDVFIGGMKSTSSGQVEFSIRVIFDKKEFFK